MAENHELTREELDKIDLDAPLPPLSPLQASNPLLQDDRKMKLLSVAMGNPVELQKITAMELRAAIDLRIARDMAEKGEVTDATMTWLVEFNDVLSSIHKNLYGTKALNVNVEGKISHAQIATLMRQHDAMNVEPKKEGD